MIALIFCSSAMLGLLVSSPSDRTGVPVREDPIAFRILALTVHDPILIDGNAGFTGLNASTGITRGSGTVDDPYIIEGWEISSYSPNSIEIENADVDFVIQDCYVHAGTEAIYLNSCSHGTIRNCTCSGNGNGIGLVYSDNNTVVYNNCSSNNNDGIILDHSNNNSLTGNSCSGGYDGISLSYSVGNVLADNNCSSNSFGINLGNSDYNSLVENNCSSSIISLSGSRNSVINNTCSGGGLTLYGSNNTISGNSMTNCESGLYLGSQCNGNTISDNRIINNTWGITGGSGYGTWSFNNTYSRNVISNNDCGLALYHAQDNILWGNVIADNGNSGSFFHYGVLLISGESPSNNLFFHNNFVNNTPQVDVSIDANSWDAGNQVGGNYWSDYTGQDLDGNGVGDTPYEIDDRNIDHYPLMTPSPPTWNPPAQLPNDVLPDEVQVGIKAGDWIKLDYEISGAPSGTPLPTWMKVEFLSVEGTNVTIRMTMHMSDGTEQNATAPVSIVSGGDALGVSGLVIPANSKTGDSIHMSGYGDVAITGETTRKFAGASRTAVYASISGSDFEGSYYWDKQTGVLVESSAVSGTMTATAKATETNMWTSDSSGILANSTVLCALVIAAIVIVVAVAFLVMRRRKGPPEVESSESFEGERE
jgi:parallel beta-helix repeat protein